MNKPFQRVGSTSNAQVGKDFELAAQNFFSLAGIELERGIEVDIGIGQNNKKKHDFDLGCNTKKILVECKSHCWTAGHNIPSAKLTAWNEAMYYFYAAPRDYRKILFVLRDLRQGTGESLAKYYLRTYNHLIPDDVEIWEYDESLSTAHKIEA